MAEEHQQVKKYDLLIVTDATSSMGSYLNALRISISEILELSRLSGVFSRLGVIAYYDYGHEEVTQKCLWNDPDLQTFVYNLRPYSLPPFDWPEAGKTGLIEAIAAADDPDTETLVLWYADAPPHHESFRGDNRAREIAKFSAGTTDWVYLVNKAVQQRLTVFTIISNMPREQYSFFVYLSQMTGGLSVSLTGGYSSETISQLTMDIILNWMGQTAPVKISEFTCRWFASSPREAIPAPTDENKGSCGYLPGTQLKEVTEEKFTDDHVPRGSVASTLVHNNLAKRFADPAEEAYRSQVYESLNHIIDTNIMALTRNPVFGQLWRAVCKEASNPKLQTLLNAFSTKVASVTITADKTVLQQWLDDSFDSTEVIMEIVSKVPTGGPVIYLDYDADIEFTRTELLEVSKSCYSGVLKKVASIFTHLKVKEADSDIVLGPEQRSLPLNLRPRQLFRTLPHLVVPGTLYPARAAAITALVAVVTGVPFLQEAAKTVLAEEKGKWLDLEVPENLSYECGKLLLSVPEGIVLTEEEHRVYSAMRRYKFVELNLDSNVDVMLPWKPEKTRDVGDFMRQCANCQKRRSITLMSNESSGVCGLCSYDQENYPEHNESQSCWVECHDATCRAQYVVENPQKLNIRPKCHYCRNNLPCPWLECTRCTNRVIVPIPCRQDMDEASFLCPACAHPENKIQVLRPAETTTRALNLENGLLWLGYQNTDIKDIFQGRSAFKLIQAHGFGVFDFAALETDKPMVQVTLGGKAIQNAKDVRAQVEGRAGRGEVMLGQCSLCFDDKAHSQLLPACGRTGCVYRADEECLRTWYAKSSPGHLLNLMQLACPFCRRRPAVKTLNKFNPQAATLGGLQAALEDRHYFYAWCLSCGLAKRAQERACCGDNWTPNIAAFRCDECRGRSAKNKEESIKLCPSCGVAVEKISGCNHISCTCGAHFCYTCGGQFDEGIIYKHMADAHGGYYDDESDDEQDEEYE